VDVTRSPRFSNPLKHLCCLLRHVLSASPQPLSSIGNVTNMRTTAPVRVYALSCWGQLDALEYITIPQTMVCPGGNTTHFPHGMCCGSERAPAGHLPFDSIQRSCHRYPAKHRTIHRFEKLADHLSAPQLITSGCARASAFALSILLRYMHAGMNALNKERNNTAGRHVLSSPQFRPPLQV
jgi:hypothetical protein